MIPFLNRIFVQPRLIVPVMLAASLFLTGCATSKAGMISTSELSHRIKSDTPPTVVDARSSGEYEAGHIPGAINIPWWSVPARHCNLPLAGEELLIIYCEHGFRARLAKLAFRVLGYQEILYLEGHMPSWEQANLPIEKSVSP